MKVLVTGGAGRIGSHVTRKLLERGDAVRVFALEGDPGVGAVAAAGAEIAFGRLQDEATTVAAVRGVDAVVHLGAALTSRGSTDEQYFEANLRGTYNMLMAVRHHAPGVRRFVSASSDAVHWGGADVPAAFLPVDETHPRQPGSVYGATKLGAEELCLTFLRAYGIPTCTVRFSATCEPWELVEPESVFGRRMFVAPAARILAAKLDRSEDEEALLARLREIDDGTDRLFVVADPGGRTSVTNLGDARDAAAGVLCMLDHREAVGEAFLVGPPAPYDERELVEYLAARLGIPSHVLTVPRVRPPWYVSSAKARGMIGYQPAHGIFAMVDEAVEARAAGRDARPA